MKPVFQTKFGGIGDPVDEQGDCIRACLASIFEIEMDDVPSFLTGTDLEADFHPWYERMNVWLATRNLCLVTVEHGRQAGMWGFAMLGTESPRIKGGHLVVVKGFDVVHDPHPKAEAGKHGKPEEWWFLVCLDPAKQPNGTTK